MNATESTQEILYRLEARIARLEKYLHLEALSNGAVEAFRQHAREETRTAERPKEARETELELRIGEYWLARIGIVALLIGIAFLIAYPFAALPAIVPSLVGYIAVAILFVLARYWQNSYQHISRTLFGGGLIVLYFATLRLHFFSANPVIASKTIGLALLVVILALQFYVATKRENQFIAGVAIVLCFATSLISETTHFALTLAALSCGFSLYLLKRYNWQLLVNATVVLVYSTHLLWLLNNPLMGRPLGAVAAHQNNLIYLFIYAAIFAVANLVHYKDASTVAARIVRTILNGLGFFVLSNLVALTYFEQRLALINSITSLFFLSAAIFYWRHHRSKYSTSIYACLGYLALSVAIVSYFESPQFYIWLSWQSLLVVTTAIWFRSKIVVVANIFIYLGILIAYLFAAPAAGLVNLNYAVVALLSARVLNWQKHHLKLRTELMRNTYLASAFVIIPYGLYHAVPKSFVSLSWLAAAVFYFVMSLILKNKKYRWMAILTIFINVIYVFIIDLARLEPAYRIISFLVLGVVLLVISLMYARYRTNVSSQQNH